ncbi:Cytoskeletal signaling slm1 [Lecanosticta acicola]|uniref:Cytoskeletal signaling slm1 n=1 Tax=Lecanosticta acicola TaxID=111012 RepID=A0AAI9ECM2_9PEZI|nr:Cytoskeletal signaling slm1 [Lecanosticta acicola]
MASPNTATSPQSASLPSRSATRNSNDDAIPDEDSSEVTKLFHERLQAWKHACVYFEDYVEATSKMYHSASKDYEKVLKTVSSPLKEGHHFDQSLGGVAGLFDNIRSNTQGIQNSNTETSKTLKGTILPIFDRLHTEIKNKTKELNKGAGKGSKAVDKARNTSQKHIELLGQHTATFDSTGGSMKAGDDPYVLQRQVYHRLNKQVQEENNNRDDMLAVQNSFSQFEAHVLETFKTGLSQFNQVVTNQTDQTRNMYGDMVANAQRIPADFEWNGFVKRNANILIDPSAPKRTVENIGFANQDHKASQPLIAGSLERKSGMLKKYDAGFYVVTPSKYLHEFKTDDDFAKDPHPENSLYLPDCLIGAVDGVKFNVRGKDTSGSSISNKMARSHEFAFKAHTAGDAQKWHSVIASVAGQTTNEKPDSTPSSPTTGKGEYGTIEPSSATTETGPAHETGTM